MCQSDQNIPMDKSQMLLQCVLSATKKGWVTAQTTRDNNVGEQQAVMAMASIYQPSERDLAANIHEQTVGDCIVSGRQADRAEEVDQHPKTTVWISACPYCRSRSYRLQYKPLARGLLVEGRCERCGTWGLSQLHSQNPLSGQELVSLEMAASLHVPVE
jgi:hypothetical protein